MRREERAYPLLPHRVRTAAHPPVLSLNRSPRPSGSLHHSLLSLFLGLATLGCAKDAPLPEARRVSSSTTAASVELRCKTGTELNGNQRFVIELSSAGPETLTGCRLTLNGSYASSLEKVIVAETWSTRAHGRTSLEPGDSLLIIGSHDVSNHHVFRDAADAPFPRDEALRTIQLTSSQGEIGWEVPD